ncbi:MAG: hypothetical protein MK102_04735 [Fuerstiella sp.]|nr:hypothetical protein [Fuerstiella sp.]
MFEDHERERFFQKLWESVRIEREVRFSLFTFGDSDLPYFLVMPADGENRTVSVRQGQVTISRAKILTPDNVQPEFHNFFESSDEFGAAEFLMSRTAAFSNLKLSNHQGSERIITDTVAEAVDQLNHRLDGEEEEHTAILSAPPGLAGFALFKYASQRVMSSAQDNLQELRERGFLP